MYYGDEIIEQVRQANPIVDVIGQYVHLERKGANYFGLCPFHNEKSPSFSVSASRQMYHCFGCGVGGNVLTFIMDYENYSFQEAVEYLADRAGITLPKQEYSKKQKEEADLRSVLLKMHKDAAYFYVHMLRSEEGKMGMDYLKKRQVSDEFIRSFGLGYAGKRPDSLYRYLKQKGYNDDMIRESGLVNIRENRITDKFWNRVIFPIMDVNNRVIGFGGRVMGTGEPKYLNSPETKIFDKSRNLYGLNTARRSREKFILVCEGYMDVISLHQHGFTNAVASLGTAFTSQHGMILKRYTDEVILTFDSDGAGQKAALRAIPILKEAGLRIRVLNMSPYKDPDEFLNNLGEEAYRERIREAKNAFMFELDVMRDSHDFSDPEDKAAFFNKAAEMIAALPDEIERNTYTEAVSNTYGMDYNTLKNSVSRIGNLNVTRRTSENVTRPRSAVKTLKNAEYGLKEAQKLILTELSDNKELFYRVKKILTPDDFSDDLYRETASYVFSMLEQGDVNPAEILSKFIETDRYKEVSELFSSSYSEELPEESRLQALKEAVFRVRDHSLDKKMNEVTDPSELMGLMEEKQKLKSLMNEF